MTTTVYVWPRHDGNPGHASVEAGLTYMSYWPANGAAPKGDFKKGTSHEAGFPSQYRTDARLEKGPASSIITLHGMNEAAMVAAWKDLKLKGTRYNMVKHNCSTVVAILLELGSGIRPPTMPTLSMNDFAMPIFLRLTLRLRYFGNVIRMWSPEAVADYARFIETRLQRP